MDINKIFQELQQRAINAAIADPKKIIWEKFDKIRHKKSGQVGFVTNYKILTDEVYVRVGTKYRKWNGINCERYEHFVSRTTHLDRYK